MIDPNWQKWIVASVNKFFSDAKDPNFLWLENEPTTALKNQSNWAELRVDGPRIDEPTKNYFTFEIDIDILCCSKQSKNILDIEKLVGFWSSKIAKCFSVKKLGDADSEVLGTMYLTDPNIRIQKWGVDDQDTPISRTSIETTYKMELYL